MFGGAQSSGSTRGPLLRFVRTREVPLEATVTHRVPLTDAPEVFAAFDRGETGKVVFTWDDVA